MKWDGKHVPKHLWGRDHHRLMLYIETRCVDYRGKLDVLNHFRTEGDKYPTILSNGEKMEGHSELNCLDDLEKEGFLENKGTGSNPVIKLTEKGWKFAHKLRRERAEQNATV